MKTKLLILFLFASLMVGAQTQISELSKGLVFHWKGDEWGQNRDAVSNIQGTATAIYPVLDRQGSGRRWYEYNGSSSYTVLPTIPAFGTGYFTVTAKIKTGAFGAVRTIVGGAANAFDLNISATGYLTAKIMGGSALTASTTLLVTATEYTVAYMRSSTTGTYYINGVTAGTCTDSNNYSVGCTLVGNGTGYFNGSIFMVRAFNFAGTGTQIANYSKPEYPIEWVDRGATGVLNVSTCTQSGTYPYNTFVGATPTSFDAIATDSNPHIAGTAAQIPVMSGKKYGFKFTLSLNSGTAPKYTLFTNIIDGSGELTVENAQNAVNGANAFVFTANGTAATATAAIYNNEPSNYSLTNLSVTQLGCVLDLNAEGMTSTYWYDRANSTAASGYTSVAATNSGTSLVIPPASNLNATFFNGSTSNIPFTGMNGLTGDITISCWIRANSTAGGGSNIIFDNTKILYYFSSTGPTIRFRRDGYTSVISSTVAINTWYNIVITSTGAGVTNIYINNVLVAVGSAGTPNSGTSWNIGNEISGSASFDGIISDIPIWNRILSQDEIKLLYDLDH